MKKKKGRLVKTLEGENKRFVVMELDRKGLFGLYDAEIDDFVYEDRLDITHIDDEDFGQIVTIFNKFKNKIDELTENKGE